MLGRKTCWAAHGSCDEGLPLGESGRTGKFVVLAVDEMALSVEVIEYAVVNRSELLQG